MGRRAGALEEASGDVVALGRASLREALPTHRHRKALLVLGVRGTLTMETPGSAWRVAPQTAIWLPAGTPHSARASNDHQACMLLVEPGVVPAALSRLRSFVPGSRLLGELIERCADLSPTSPRHDRVVAVLLDELTDAFTGSRDPVAPPALPADERLRRIAEGILRAPSTRVSMGQWARRVGMSERSLRRLLQVELGTSFALWRQQLYVDVAIRRLTLGDTVKSIAADLDYESPSAFSAMFKRVSGTSPGAYCATQLERKFESALHTRPTFAQL